MESAQNASALYGMFHRLVEDSVSEHVSAEGQEPIKAYLASLLVEFLHTDRIFALRDGAGHRLASVMEMLAEGDIRANAASFERERQVHKHIGDFLLFWSGVFPEFLRHLKLRAGHDLLCDYNQQGKQSYRVVSLFDHEPYREEAPLFRQLSQEFEAYAFCLRSVRDRVDPRAFGSA